jgi:flagellar motor switch protein FliM
MKKVLTQEEIDAMFHAPAGESGDEAAAADVTTFDLSHLDRIPKTQLRALHMVHENFVRSLASSLSAYLRSYVALNLVSLEQISYSEFIDGLSFPSCIAYVSLSPYDGTAVLEMNASLTFMFLELLMGSKGRSTTTVQRKITDIEKSIMQTLLRVVLQDLREAWKSVTDIGFAVQSLASEPQLTHVLAPADAVIVIAVDVNIGGVSGLMNLAIPSIFIKRIRLKFDQLQQVRKTQSNPRDRAYINETVQEIMLNFDAFIDGGNITAKTLLDLKIDDVIIFDQPTDGPLKGLLNGQEKWSGTVVAKRDKLAFEIIEAQSERQ